MNRWADVAIATCSFAFVVVLAIAAYWDPTIRVLHVFEALPYLAAAILCLLRVRFGYPLAFASGAFWLWMAGTLTTFVRNGFERLGMLVRTGTVDRWDIFIAAPAAITTGGLAVFALAGYAQFPKKSGRDLVLFVAALVIVAAFFLAIIATFAPRYLGMFVPLLRRITG